MVKLGVISLILHRNWSVTEKTNKKYKAAVDKNR